MITDDDLLLYHYRELDAAERTRIGAALASDAELARRLQALVARLDAAAAIPDVDVPADVQARWASALERAAGEDRIRSAAPARRGAWRFAGWQPLAAAAAVCAVVIGVQLLRPEPVTTPGRVVVRAPAGEAGATAYENGLKVHLARTERRLASLEGATPEERARLVDTIIEQNRLYALAAERAGEPQLARVLRAFAPVLENVAADRESATASSLAQLEFELRVLQARLGADVAAHPHSL